MRAWRADPERADRLRAQGRQHDRRRQEDPARAAIHRERERLRFHTQPHVRELHRLSNHKRRARLAELPHDLTPREWGRILSRANGHCFYCSKQRALTMDHVLPLARGGSHSASNVVAACRTCNTGKRDRLLTEWHRARPYLGKRFAAVCRRFGII